MIKLADTLAPMADFPAAMAEHIEFEDGKSLQEKYDLGELGGEGGGNFKIYTKLSEIGLDSSANVYKVVRTLEEGEVGYFSVQDFSDKTQFPLNEQGFLKITSNVYECFY